MSLRYPGAWEGSVGAWTSVEGMALEDGTAIRRGCINDADMKKDEGSRKANMILCINCSWSHDSVPIRPARQAVGFTQDTQPDNLFDPIQTSTVPVPIITALKF